MIESYVDLAYRGLALARRVKLTSVRPREGYVEMPQPMPVGTQLELSSDDGPAIAARVIAVTEQTGGANGAPGMQIAPVLEGAAAAWWSARVALPDAPPAPKRLVIQPTAPVATATPAPPVVPKQITAPMAAVAAPVAAPAVAVIVSPPPPTLASELALAASAMDAATIPMPILDDVEDVQQSKRTIVMDAVVADELLAQAAQPDAEPAHPPVIIDDGRSTTVMEAVDLSALGLDPNGSGSLRMITQTDPVDGADDSGDDKSKPTAAGKKKRKRR